MNIQKFKVTDLEQMMVFLDDNLSENYERGVFLNIHQRWTGGFLLVKEDENIVGVGCGAILPNEKLRVLILALNKKVQGQGLGKELMNKMIEESKGHGVRKVTLEVRTDSKAITFYRKLGFSGAFRGYSSATTSGILSQSIFYQ